MAEFTLGLTKMAVEGTLSKVKSAIEEEKRLRVRVEDDLVFITGEFQMMQSFLNVANTERTNNQVVRTWVRQVRDLAFHVEDCVEFVVHLDKASRWDWVRRLTSSLICMARPPLPLDVAVAEIKRLKTRVEDVSQRNTRYSLISDSGSSSNSAVTTVSSPEAEKRAATDGASSFHILCEVWEAAGKKRRGTGDLKKLINSEGSDLQVISLWGSPCVGSHLGETHVIREAYNDLEICQEFSIRAWVKLLHPFNPDVFLKSLLAQFHATASSHQPRSLDHFLATDDHRLIKTGELMEQVREHRYLVILEDVCTVAEWDVIKMYLPDNNKGSRIVVSTQQLGLALSYMRKPYQVSELRQFSHGQSLCAFNSKVPGRRSDMSEFSWQLRCGGVKSMWDDSESSTLLDSVYTSITHKSKGFSVDGVEFEKNSWVDVPNPFNLDVFSKRLLLSLYSDDYGSKEISVVGRMGDRGIINRCRRFLREDQYLVVINGLKSPDQWDSIKATFLSEPIKGCILVVAKDESLARYCIDEEHQAINIKDLEADTMLRHLIKSCEYYGIGGREASRRGRLFSNRTEEARIWTKKFGHVMRQGSVSTIQESLREPFICLSKRLRQPSVISVWGTAGAGKLPLVRKIYYDQMLIVRQDDNITSENYHEDMYISDMKFTKFSWVDVPHPFNLTDFFWRLLLDFHSDDLEAKETAAIGMMKGQDDPIQGCLKFMRQDRCFVVINGLRSTHDWNLIRDAFLSSDPSRSCIVIITNEESVATHCADDEGRVLNVKGVEAEAALRPLIKDCGYYGNECEEASRFFSSRREEAIYWAKTFEPVGCQIEAATDLAEHSSRINVGLSSVWGIAGVGKSAIVSRIYYHRMLDLGLYKIGNRSCWMKMQGRFTKFSWVNVPHPFSLMDFCWYLLVDFHSDDLEAKETAAVGMIDGIQDPIQECRKFLQTECFVVIDGLGSTRDWDLIRDALLPETTKGCIVVIANEKNVARHCVPYGNQVINIKGLEPDAALHLFSKVALGGKQLSPNEIEVSKFTMAKCGGIPKVIAVIGEQYRASKRRISFLEYLNDDFMGILEKNSRFHSLRGLFSWMQSYFDACSDALKPCIFYLSVFPADYSFRRKRLLRRWIAEGYSREKFGISTLEDGEMLFSELVKLSIIQELGGKLSYVSRERQSMKVDMFQVNGFFHGYIISRPMEDNLVFALERRCSPNLKHAGQHLTIRSSWDRDEIVFKSMDLSRLRSLTVFGEWRSFFISKDVNMGLLRVLDMEDTSGVTDGNLEHIGKLLPRLKFLSVRGCKDITRVPDSLGGLRQLQTLDVKHTSIVELPPAIIKLHKLQYIRAGTTHEPLDQGHDTQPPAPADHDGTSTSQPAIAAAHSDGASTSQPAVAAADSDGTSTSQPTAITPQTDAHGASTSQPTATPPADAHGASTSQPMATPLADGDDQDRASTTIAPWRNKAHDFVNWFSKEKKLCRHQRLDDDNGGGVKVPAAGIGNMTALHTFGVINVGGISGKAVLREVKKLTQLRKLRLSGINWRNWQDFCCTISSHGYLESLSIRLDDGQQDHLGCLGDISKPPKTLKSLKLYGGNVHVSPVWMKQLDGLKKAHLEDLELTISTQEDIDSLMELRCQDTFHHLCVKPIQDGELRYGRWESYWGGEQFKAATILKIDCGSYRSKIVFGDWIVKYVEVLVVHCSSTESSLELSGLEKLENLKEVWLKGSYSDAVRQHLQQKVDEHEKKPVLELEDQQTHQSAPPTPCACLKRLLT